TYKTAEAYPNSASPRDLRVRLSAIDLKLTVPAILGGKVKRPKHGFPRSLEFVCLSLLPFGHNAKILLWGIRIRWSKFMKVRPT
ncbi:MAG: hypothetical protein QW801_01270, partial [Candidatus Caldarchaeum sp.]